MRHALAYLYEVVALDAQVRCSEKVRATMSTLPALRTEHDIRFVRALLHRNRNCLVAALTSVNN